MKKIVIAALYMALTVGAIPGHADTDAAIAARSGDMKKLIFHSAPEAVSNAAYDLADGAGQGTLADYKGKHVLVNFWATWCAPCRHEMPMLSELQAEFGGDDFEVVTIATGRNNPAAISQFLEDINATNLPRHQDPKQKLAAQMGVFGLPITVLIDPEGREIARLRGDADWSSDSAKAVISALIGAKG
ncbi:TlpA disulfide reductase family protein [uncultured Tateyamaria sp.]|uniref:TlpA disulfide reductase family protein n=1 Tax=uncultured Tateyamaria sp. TaxID=455651 RepID=UPI002615AECD|nr:TlpA disulfide reductase family protein [uncultured Tateyamaria sp.]